MRILKILTTLSIIGTEEVKKQFIILVEKELRGVGIVVHCLITLLESKSKVFVLGYNALLKTAYKEQRL